MLRNLLLFLFLFSYVHSHEESGPWSCDSGSEIRIDSDFKPGVITLDGHADDWKDIDGSQFALLPALDPDAENEFNGGKMTVKVLFPLVIHQILLIFSSYSLCCFRVCMMAVIFSFCCKLIAITHTLMGKVYHAGKTESCLRV